MNNAQRTAMASMVTCVLAYMQSVQAQQSDGQATTPILEEVVVNARRVEENLQRVPIAITVVPEDLIRRRNVRTFEDMAMNIAGLTVFGGRGRVNSVATNIRGVPGVVGYLAEVPVNLDGSGLIFDLENVQALKGPQGTLFGTSTNGGALLIQPVLPSDQIEGYGQVTVGSYGRRVAEGALNVPLFNGRLNTRAAFINAHTDGIGRRVDTNELLGDENYWAARFSSFAHLTENLENYTLVNYSSSHSTPFPNVLRAVDPAGRAASIFGAETMASMLAQQQELGNYKVAGVNVSGLNESRSLNVVNTTTYRINDTFTLKNIFGYERARFLTIVDLDGTLAPISHIDPRTQGSVATPTWSEELQVVGTKLWNKLDVQIGTFHTGSKSDSRIVYGHSFGSVSATTNRTSYRTRAIYGQGNFDLSSLMDGLSLTAGYRYTWDRRSQIVEVLNPSTLQVVRNLSGNGEFSAASYTFGLQYQYSPDVMVFLNNSKGYSSGGLTVSAPPPFNRFEPESLNNVEVGVKSQFAIGDVGVRANVSYFYGWYDDQIITQARLVRVNPSPAPPSLLSVRTNAGKSKPTGFEADITVVPKANLELAGSVSYTKAEYDEFDTLGVDGNPVSKAGLPFLATSKWKFTAHATYYLPIPGALGDIGLSVDYSWYDKVLVDSTAVNPDPGPYRAFRPSREFLDVSLRWQDVLGHVGLSAALYGTNLTKEVGTVSGMGGWSLTGFSADTPAEPRMFGARVSYSF